MSEAQDSLIRLRQMSFDRSASDISRATSELRRAHELLSVKKNSAGSIEERRDSISKEIHVLHDAHWLAYLWAFDRQLAVDLEQAREEVGWAECNLTGRREDLSEKRRELSLAQAKLYVAHNLRKRRRRTSNRRRERRLEEEMSGIRTWCL